MSEPVRHALILEGGAMRGLFTCGVIDVFMEEGIVFDAAIGVSAGAVFGSNLKSHQHGRPLRYNTVYCRDRRYCSLWSLITTGDLYGADFCYRILPDELDVFDRQTFAEDPMLFWVTATDTQTGRPVYHLCTDGGAEDITWMQASASMPLVSRPVHIDGRRLLDGGISDSIPFRFMEEQGYRRNVIVLTQPEDYRKKKSAALPLMRMFMKKYPAIVQAMAERHILYNMETEAIRSREAEGAAFVIRPQEALNVGRVEKNPEKLKEAYAAGRKEALRRLPELKEYLSHEA